MRFRPLLWPSVMSAVMLAVLVALGVWQLERRDWKLGLIAQMQERLAGPEQPLAAIVALSKSGGSIAYRHAAAAGHYGSSGPLFWFTPGPEGEPGYHLIAPLLLDDGTALIVDRGFIPAALKDSAASYAAPAGPVTVHGIIRESQQGGLFTPKDELAEGLVFARNVPQLAAALGLSPVQPFFLEADASPNPGGWPLGGQTRVTLRNEHLQYALTWFGLAEALVIVYVLYHRSRGRIG